MWQTEHDANKRESQWSLEIDYTHRINCLFPIFLERFHAYRKPLQGLATQTEIRVIVCTCRDRRYGPVSPLALKPEGRQL
jgi:hypothetical protein